MYQVSVNQAISRGRRSIYLPALGILFGAPVIFYLVLPYPYNIMYLPVLVLVSFALAGLYWSYAVPRWLIWAFSNVRNVHELRRRATYALLISDETDPNLRRLERWNENQKREWKKLELRFNQADEFTDDPATPAETRVYFSLIKRFLVLPLYLLMAIGGGALFFLHQEAPFSFKAITGYLIQTLFCGGGVWLTYITVSQMLNRQPQIIINNEGLMIAGSTFSSWSVINNISIIKKGTAKYRTYHLEYYIHGLKLTVELDAFSIGRNKIDHYIHVYRGRFMQKQVTQGRKT